MRNILRLAAWTTVFGLVMSLGIPPVASAANEVTVSDNTLLVLPADSSQYTLSSGSTFDSLEILTSTFHFSMSGGSTITLTSADKKNFTSVPVIPVTCSTNQSSITLTFAAGAPTQPVDVTPSGTCDAASGPGGGSPSIGQSSPSPSSGGGGSPPPAPPPPPPAPVPVPVPTPTPAAPPPPSSSGTPPPAFPASTPPAVSPLIFKNLFPGNRGKEVRQLQLLLAQDKDIYPSGVANGVYGSATRNAVKKFQAKYGISQTGSLGPLTRAKLQQVFGQPSSSPTPAAAPVPTPTPAASPAHGQASPAFTINLQRGNSGDDVKRLQQLLSTDPELYPEAAVSGFFGPATQRAIQRFQEKHDITPNGRVGPQTRVKLQEIFGTQTTQPPAALLTPPNPVPAPAPVAPKTKLPQIKSLQDQILQLQKTLLELQKR